MMVNRQLLTAQIAGMFMVFALALFLAAGTVAWPAGWVFLVLFFGFVVALTLWLLRHNPGLLTERMTGIGKPDQKSWDKVFYVVANVVFLAWLVVMPLDAVMYAIRCMLRRSSSWSAPPSCSGRGMGSSWG